MKANIEYVYLAIFFIVFLTVSVGTLWDHRIKHDFPYSYLASDTFQHQVRTESIKQMGNYRYEAPYIVAGYKDNIGFYPPIIYHLGVIFSYSSDLETYDSTYLLVFILSFFSTMIMYVIIRQFSKNIALISLPISILIFSKAAYIGFTWGSWASLTGQFFMLFLFWSLIKISMEDSYWLIGLALSGITLTHTSEAIFVAIFLILFLSYKWVTKDIKKIEIKNLMKSFALFLIVSFYYLTIFYFTWSIINPYSFSIEKNWGNSPVFTLGSFGFLSLFLILGVIFSLYLKDKSARMVALIGFVSLFLGFGNYFGFGIRAFQLRLFWPIYLSFFVGLGIYYLLRGIIKKVQIIHSVTLSVILLIILNLNVSSAFIPTTMKFTSPGIMNPYHWQMFKFLQRQKEGGTLFLYGDTYGQNAILRNSYKINYMVNFNDYFATLQNKTIKRFYKINLLGDHHGVNYAYRKSFFSYGYHAREAGYDYFYNSQRDICNFTYYVIDSYSSQPVIAQYNQLVRSKLLENSFIKEIFKNEVTSVLLNTKQGEDCMPKEGIKIE